MRLGMGYAQRTFNLHCSETGKFVSIDSYEFGQWRFDPDQNKLSNNDQVVHLERKATEVLHYLLQRPGETVSIDDLLGSVWSDRVVEPNVVHRNLSRIRHALGDNPQSPLYIETISKRGYRTIAQVTRMTLKSPTREAQAEPDPQKHRESEAGVGVSRLRRLWPLGAATLFGLVLSAYFLVQNPTTRLTKHVASNSLAVLPFEDLDPNGKNSYFTAGTHEEVINRLFQISDISVIARSSTIQYTNTIKTAQEIAAELGVGHILSGTARYMDDQIRFSVQLIEAKSGAYVWSQTYDGTLDDIFSLQNRIASEIVSHLSSRFIKPEKNIQQRSPEAYLKYLQARHLLGLGDDTSERFTSAETLLNEAIAIDPSDITIIMELARLRLQRDSYGGLVSAESLEIRLEMVRSALVIDPNHAVANAWYGWQLLFIKKNFEQAARQYEKATALEPRNVNILRGLTIVLLEFDRTEEAQAVAEYVARYDPLCAICVSNLARVYLTNRNYKGAAKVAANALAFAPKNRHAWQILSIAQLLGGAPQAALQTLELHDSSPYTQAVEIIARYELGLNDAANIAFQRLQAESPDAHLAIAAVHASAHELDQAFEHLEYAIDSGMLDQVSDGFGGPLDPLYNNLMQDPRWLDLLSKIGHAPGQLDLYAFNPTLPSSVSKTSAAD